jgi:Glycosyltransferase family 87
LGAGAGWPAKRLGSGFHAQATLKHMLENNSFIQKFSRTFLLIIGAVSIFIAICFDGTRDSGDSVMHYLMSHYSWSHPDLFLNHWGKPFFTLVSSPFSQFGFTGMKLFNVGVCLLTAWLLFQVATRWGFKYAWLIPFLLFLMPAWFLTQFSGLTEPLFALFVVLPLWLRMNDRHALAALAVGMLPFIRSEGVFIIAVWGIYFLMERRWLQLPLLLAGNVFFGLIGWMHYGSPLWYFTKNPYAIDQSNYGSGTWMHFPEKMIFLCGIPIVALLAVGLVVRLSSFVIRSLRASGNHLRERMLMVLGCFAVYFLAHVVFWRFGWYHSMGLERVMVAVLPLCAWFAAEGVEFLANQVAKIHVQGPRILVSGILVYVLVFPFTPNPAAMHIQTDFMFKADQLAINSAALKLSMPGATSGRVIYSSHPSVFWQANVDPFDASKKGDLKQITGGAGKPGDYIIWDDWFSVIEEGISQGYFAERPSHFKLIFRSQGMSHGKKHEIYLYEIIQPISMNPEP